MFPSFHGFGETILDSLYKHSTWPLDCALVGEVTLCCIPHIFLKSLNYLDMNCVPPSETIHLGTPLSLTISLRCLITLVEWRLQFSDNGELTEIINC